MYNNKLHFHFTGIGGSGMSGIAEVLLDLGFRVSGSDLKSSAVIERLKSLGAVVYAGHQASHVPADTTSLVYSSAVSMANPEILEARQRGIPVIRRAEVLAELMRLKFGVAVAGSHGKTTTTSMIAAVLEHGGLDPTVIIGGQVKSLGSGGKRGKSDFLVAETDESDRSFLLLRPTISVITNIDGEHLGAYGSLADLELSFEQFAHAIPFYGLAVLCVDDPRVRSIAERYRKRKVTYGLSPDAHIRASNLSFFRDATSFTLHAGDHPPQLVRVPVLGQHLVQNSLAAVAVGLEFGVSLGRSVEALTLFSGVKRRIESVGEVGGVTVMTDYGHHPTEIRCTLQAIRSAFADTLGRLHVIFQPHRYSRTRECFTEFLDAFHEADSVVVTEIYAAGEEPLEGICGENLAEAIHHPSRRFVRNLEEVLPGLLAELHARDVVLCLGAGSIGALPEQIVSELEKREYGLNNAV